MCDVSYRCDGGPGSSAAGQKYSPGWGVGPSRARRSSPPWIRPAASAAALTVLQKQIVDLLSIPSHLNDFREQETVYMMRTSSASCQLETSRTSCRRDVITAGGRPARHRSVSTQHMRRTRVECDEDSSD